MKLQIYFDYLCPYCEAGWRRWRALLPGFPQIIPQWHPCEAHPRKYESLYGRHSDFATKGMLYIQEIGGDTTRYNDLVFTAAWEKKSDIEDLAVLAECAAECGVETAAFLAAVQSTQYDEALEATNRHAWVTRKLSAVPSFETETGALLVAQPGIGVSEEALRAFLENCCNG